MKNFEYFEEITQIYDTIRLKFQSNQRILHEYSEKLTKILENCVKIPKSLGIENFGSVRFFSVRFLEKNRTEPRIEPKLSIPKMGNRTEPNRESNRNFRFQKWGIEPNRTENFDLNRTDRNPTHDYTRFGENQ